MKSATFFYQQYLVDVLLYCFWRNGRGEKNILWLFQQPRLGASRGDSAPYSKYIVRQNRIIFTYLQCDHWDISYSWRSVVAVTQKSLTFTGSGRSVCNMMLTCVLRVKSEISHPWWGFINTVKEDVWAFSQNGSHKCIGAFQGIYAPIWWSLQVSYQLMNPQRYYSFALQAL